MIENPGTLEGWTDRAACQGQTDVFFVNRGDTSSVVKAKAICEQCPVLEECRSYVLYYPERYGIWGGMTEKERRNYRLQMGVVLPAAQHGTLSRYRSGCRCTPCRSSYNSIMRIR